MADGSDFVLSAGGRRPLSVGFWFSLGHSTIVFLLAVALGVWRFGRIEDRWTQRLRNEPADS